LDRRGFEAHGTSVLRTLVAGDAQAPVAAVFDPAEPLGALNSTAPLGTSRRDFVVIALTRQAAARATLSSSEHSKSALPHWVVCIPPCDPRTVAHLVDDAVAGAARCRALAPTFNSLHAVLVSGDSLGRGSAREAICELVRPEIRGQLRMWREAQAEPDDVIDEAANDALVTYLNVPGRYDPRRGDPIPWLMAIARNKVRDQWRRRTRIRGREQPLSVDIERRVSERAQVEASQRELSQTHTAELLSRLLSVCQTDSERRYVPLHLSQAPLAPRPRRSGWVTCPSLISSGSSGSLGTASGTVSFASRCP
jgi:DNA-directed RNA polymerase specialized sigma24 family protein